MQGLNYRPTKVIESGIEERLVGLYCNVSLLKWWKVNVQKDKTTVLKSRSTDVVEVKVRKNYAAELELGTGQHSCSYRSRKQICYSVHYKKGEILKDIV